MAIDPGTALAIVSLGLTVCDGVIGYFSAVKHRKGDVQSLIAISMELQAILSEIQAWLAKHPVLSIDMSNRVESCVKNCLVQIDLILGICADYCPPASTDLTSRLNYVRNGLIFPFKKDAIQNLKDQIGSLRSNVELALILLASYVTADICKLIVDVL
jgi:hypothetical protein